jgi:hypothetical protein
MRGRRAALAIACAVLIAQPALGQRWWEEAASQGPLDQVSIEDDGARRVNWMDGYLEVVAEGTCDPAMSVSQAHCRTLALATARALAYQKLTESVYGISIDAENSYRDRALQDSRLETETHGLIRGARIIDESHEILPDGSVLARVRLGILLAGQRGLSSVAMPYVLDNAQELQRGAIDSELETLRKSLAAELARAQALSDSLEAARAALPERTGEEPVGQAVERALAAADAAERALAAARQAEDNARQAERAAVALRAQTGTVDEELADRLQAAEQAAQEASRTAADVAVTAEALKAAAADARAAAEQTGHDAQQVAEALSEAREVRNIAAATQAAASEVAGYAQELESAAGGAPSAELPPELIAELQRAKTETLRARAAADSLARAAQVAQARAEAIRLEVVERGEASSVAVDEARAAREDALRARQEMEALVASAKQTAAKGNSLSSQARAAAAGASGEISGIIIDASGLGARPALSPKVLTPGGEEIYGPSRVPREVVMNVGLVAYANSLGRAKDIERVGGNPLVVRALSTGGSNKANLVISEEDAKLIAELGEKGEVFDQCAWCVVIS